MASGRKKTVSLSQRELQVIELVAAGLTNQDVAAKLEISKRTVDNHVSNILTKTTTGNRVELVRWAMKWGKVCIDEVNCCSIQPQSTGVVKSSCTADPPPTDTGGPISPPF